MGRNPKYSKELKLKIVKRYLKGESTSYLAKEYNLLTKGIDREIRSWANKYEVFGESAFDYSSKNKSYSKELKLQVIRDYINGIDSMENLANKYNVTNRGIVRKWIIKYNKGIEIKDYDPKSEVYTMKARKTTLEERLEIINYVLANDNDYKGAADKYNVPYASVYQWVLKYNKYGENSLKDRRGRPSSFKHIKELTLEEKQAIEIEKLKRELEREKMINEVLKKNIEIREQMKKDSQKYYKNMSTKR